MEYAQADMSAYYTNDDFVFEQVAFQYTPLNEKDKAALNFHLTQREKRDIGYSLNSELNQKNFLRVSNLVKKNELAAVTQSSD